MSAAEVEGFSVVVVDAVAASGLGAVSAGGARASLNPVVSGDGNFNPIDESATAGVSVKGLACATG